MSPENIDKLCSDTLQCYKKLKDKEEFSKILIENPEVGSLVVLVRLLESYEKSNKINAKMIKYTHTMRFFSAIALFFAIGASVIALYSLMGTGADSYALYGIILLIIVFVGTLVIIYSDIKETQQLKALLGEFD